jgi:8-oxo-dGTP pyrophosphatase MutT (NUDIX family)
MGVASVIRKLLLIKAAGGLVWRFGPGGPRLAVIHRPRRGDWSLPKGKLKPEESFTGAARREVAEETGCRPRLGRFAGFTLYFVKRRLKLVLFWHMSVRHAGRFRPNEEVDRLEWLTPEKALKRLDHPAERRLVRGAREVRSPSRRG